MNQSFVPGDVVRRTEETLKHVAGMIVSIGLKVGDEVETVNVLNFMSNDIDEVTVSSITKIAPAKYFYGDLVSLDQTRVSELVRGCKTLSEEFAAQSVEVLKVLGDNETMYRIYAVNMTQQGRLEYSCVPDYVFKAKVKQISTDENVVENENTGLDPELIQAYRFILGMGQIREEDILYVSE